jgi:hypothetical protein
MTKKTTLKNISRTEFKIEYEDGKTFSSEQIKLSALLRIADGIENMGKSYVDMQADIDFLTKKNTELLAENNQNKRTIANLQSQITKKRSYETSKS